MDDNQRAQFEAILGQVIAVRFQLCSNCGQQSVLLT